MEELTVIHDNDYFMKAVSFLNKVVSADNIYGEICKREKCLCMIFPGSQKLRHNEHLSGLHVVVYHSKPFSSIRHYQLKYRFIDSSIYNQYLARLNSLTATLIF